MPQARANVLLYKLPENFSQTYTISIPMLQQWQHLISKSAKQRP